MIVLTIVAWSDTQAVAFNKFGADWTKEGAARPTKILFYLCAVGAPPGAISAIKAAFAIWSYENLSLSAQAGNCRPSDRFPVRNALNRIDFGPLEPDVAATSKVWYKGWHIEECDIRFNDKLTWNTLTNPPGLTQWDLISVAAHEIGHCLGLAHEYRSFAGKPSIMNPMLGEGELRRMLTADDRAGRNVLYGKKRN